MKLALVSFLQGAGVREGDWDEDTVGSYNPTGFMFKFTSVQLLNNAQEQILKVQLLVSVTVTVANAVLERQVARGRLDGMDWGSRMFTTDDCTWQKHCAWLVCVPVWPADTNQPRQRRH